MLLDNLGSQTEMSQHLLKNTSNYFFQKKRRNYIARREMETLFFNPFKHLWSNSK